MHEPCMVHSLNRKRLLVGHPKKLLKAKFFKNKPMPPFGMRNAEEDIWEAMIINKIK